MEKPLKGQRYYRDGERGRFLARVIHNDLPFMDYEGARKFYRLFHASGPSTNEVALLGCNDRFYLLTEILKRVDARHSWLYNRTREVETDPDGYLDLWAREHYKSTIITFAGIIQEVMIDPEITVGIFSNVIKGAASFLMQIKGEFERNDLLRETYPDVLWERPRVEAPQWSVDKGLVVKRVGNPKEATIEASGLIDGMPTGKHYRLMVYDDLITEKNVTNPEMVRKTTEAWELSDNLGAGDVRTWMIGTRYCTIGSSRITMGDWSHKPISEVQIGETVVGWEKLANGKRILRRAKVINCGVHRAQRVNKYTFANGRSVVCTADHKWWRGPWKSGPEYNHLAIPRRPERSRINVVGAPEMVPGKGIMAIRQLLVPVEEGHTRDDGWLAGMYDGEGTFKKNKNHPSGVPCIIQTMHNPDVVEEIRGNLSRLKFEWTENWWSATNEEGCLRPDMRHDRCVFNINGGWAERYRFLAQINPTRREKIADSLFGQLTTDGLAIEQVEEQEPQDVYWLETETGNYVVEGFCSSNSFGDSYGLIIDRKAAIERRYAATDNGKMDGKPVFMSEKRWEDKKRKQRSTIAAQMLQNPLGANEQTFQPSWFGTWEVRPSAVNIYIMGDPSKGRSARSDRTAFAVVAVDNQGGKYFVDGYRHRMGLSDRWAALKNLYKKWMAEPGVQAVFVGYEVYGLQTDLEYFNERMLIENESFSIKELNWTKDGNQSKKDRVERLEPDIRGRRFLFPAIIHEPGKGDCYWSIDKESGRLATRPKIGQTAAMKRMEQAGQSHRIARSLRRLDEDRKVYDLTSSLIEELLYFPFAPHDDLVDAASRIYDMNPVSPALYENHTGGDVVAHLDFADS